MGSDSDLATMRPAVEALAEFGVPTEVRILSAHRTPVEMLEYARAAAGRGLRVIVAGVDALLSIVQMPAGVPVATVAIGGGRNAGLLAVRILAAGDPALRQAMERFQADLAETVRAKDAAVRAQFDS
jgi:5-(carboxyamino)imidazole ribonucleotide mutase